MTLTTGTPAETDTCDPLDPATGRVLASHPVHSARQVRSVVAGARGAAGWWQAQGWDGRR